MPTHTTRDLGHLGLVAGMCKKLNIAQVIDRALPQMRMGIHLLYRGNECLGVLNLEDRRWQMINQLGYQDYYT
ncbi:MAG: DUF4277 domain-containing protein [bacterium]